METHARVVYNRSDCPYGCGAPLARDLRWQRTPCHRCKRPLYPLSATTDKHGQILWPPASVPRPPEAEKPGVQVWYVVTEEEARDGIAIGKAETQMRVDASEGQTYLIVVLMVVVVVVIALVIFGLVLAPR